MVGVEARAIVERVKAVFEVGTAVEKGRIAKIKEMGRSGANPGDAQPPGVSMRAGGNTYVFRTMKRHALRPLRQIG